MPLRHLGVTGAIFRLKQPSATARCARWQLSMARRSRPREQAATVTSFAEELLLVSLAALPDARASRT